MLHFTSYLFLIFLSLSNSSVTLCSLFPFHVYCGVLPSIFVLIIISKNWQSHFLNAFTPGSILYYLKMYLTSECSIEYNAKLQRLHFISLFRISNLFRGQTLNQRLQRPSLLEAISSSKNIVLLCLWAINRRSRELILTSEFDLSADIIDSS